MVLMLEEIPAERCDRLGGDARIVEASAALYWLGRHRSLFDRLDADGLLAWLGALCVGGGRVRLHTTPDAHERLCAWLGIAPDAFDALLSPPPSDQARELVAALARPAHIGCMHVRQWTVGSAPQSQNLLRDLMAAFVRGRWMGWSGLDYVVDDGLDDRRCTTIDAATHGRLVNAAASCGLLPTFGATDI